MAEDPLPQLGRPEPDLVPGLFRGRTTTNGNCLINCSGASGGSNLFAFHAGGVDITLGDGSSRFLSENIDFETMCRLVARQDGKIVGEF